MSGMPGTRLRTSLVGRKEMALGHLVFILGRGRYWSLGISDRGDETAADMEEEEEDGRSRLMSAFTAVPHIHKMTPRGEKNCSIYLPFPLPYILPAAFINICHFPGGLDMSSNSF